MTGNDELFDGWPVAERETEAPMIETGMESLTPEPGGSKSVPQDWELNEGQSAFITKAVNWFFNSTQQVFTLRGPAGTGKTSVVKKLMEELDLDDWSVRFVAYTGKAADVLTRKGTPASTIHGLIYEIAHEDVKDPKTNKVVDKKKVWRKRIFLEDSIRLIVVDESSMLDPKILNDLKSYGTKLLLIGDHAQLPPVKPEEGVLGPSGYDMLKTYWDAELTEVVRQAKENPILWLATWVREGHGLWLPKGMHGDSMLVIPKSEIDYDQDLLTSADVVVVGTNKTRKLFNHKVRGLLGHTDSMLPAAGEKVICLKNDWNTVVNGQALINGLTGHCIADVEEVDDYSRWFRMDFRPDHFKESDPFFSNLKCALDYFDEPEDWRDRKIKGAEFDFANALTCHKLQGSEYDMGFIYGEPFGNESERRAWIYTSLTRVKKVCVYAQ
jgi:exodeoxyribonuclease-5